MKAVEYIKTSAIGKLFFILFLVILSTVFIGVYGLCINDSNLIRIGSTIPLLTLFFMFPFFFEFFRSIREFDTMHRWVIRIHDRERRYTSCFQDDFYSDLEHSIFKLTEATKKELEKDERVKKLLSKNNVKPKGDIYAVIGKHYCFLTNIISIEKTNLLLGFGQNLVVRGDSKQFDINTGIAYSFYPTEIIKSGQVLGDTLKRLAELKDELAESVPKTSVEVIKETINYYDRGLREARIAIGKTQPAQYILTEKEQVQVNPLIKRILLIVVLAAVGLIVFFLLF